ncbi:MAG: hypothetical protein DME95_00730 [Verrucomicrobia bacterium]|nr:MAG: hypothetical protein DME95_00730 [Verrucomicrobiota bacterium]
MRTRLSSAMILVITASATGQTLPAGPHANARAGCAIPAEQMHASSWSGDFDTPPKFIRGDAPIYPITRLRLREPGFASIACVVDETGHTRDFRVLKTNYPYFASHAIIAMQKWQFQPAMKRGHPVRCTVRIPFYFRVGR